MKSNLLYKPKVFKNSKGTWTAYIYAPGTWTAYIYAPNGDLCVDRPTWIEAFNVAFKNAKLQINSIYY